MKRKNKKKRTHKTNVQMYIEQCTQNHNMSIFVMAMAKKEEDIHFFDLR